MTIRFLSAFFVTAFLLLLSLTASNADVKTSVTVNNCQNNTCPCFFSDSELQHTT